MSDAKLIHHYGLGFNVKPSTIMHIDLNSCFAIIEQQANRKLRGHPIAVAAYKSPGGCILAPSVEAKKFGIKTGMRVREGKILCPNLIVLEPDPPKYRFVHKKLKQILEKYSPKAIPKSIDEFVLDLEGCPSFKLGMREVAAKIKLDIKREIGDFITVSIGIAPNRFLAKLGSSLHKPDGLDEINKDNFLEVYKGICLEDLCGIAKNNAARLMRFGIHTVLDFYMASAATLKRVFHSIVGYHWYLRLRGWEIDDIDFGRKSFGNSYALPKPVAELEKLSPILVKLTEKMCFRLRLAGFKARGVGVFVTYQNGGFWRRSQFLDYCLYESSDFLKAFYKLLSQSPYKEPVKVLSVFCFELEKSSSIQLDMFGVQEQKFNLANSVDAINSKWGDFVLGPASLLLAKNNVWDRISFGGFESRPS